MNLKRTLYTVGIILLLISAIPLFYIFREVIIGYKLDNQYSIEHVDEKQGFPGVIDKQKIKVNGRDIEISEEATGKKASLTFWDKESGVEAGDIVKIHLKVDGQEVSKADEIWLSNRDLGSRYYSWLDILRVNDKVAIVQRLTDDDTHKEDSKWKIIWIEENGKITEEQVSYPSRGNNPLAVKLINYSGTAQTPMGYYSEVLSGYPTIFFPLLYPIGTGLLGIILCIGAFLQRKRLKV